MATLKHLGSKNADYGAAEQYLLFEHDEFTMKPVLDENGRLIPREDYRLSTLNCGGEDFAVACMRSNLRYEKNQRREDVKSHHYIISFDPRDGPDNGLTVDRAQALGEQFCKEHFPGHQALVCTHPDGHNHSGNIHVHIVINSLRIEEVPFLPYMDRPGHEKGAFTGANEQKKGLFEIANGGTLFLDEIGEMPLEAQGVLLRVLEGGRFTRVGGTEEISVDVRLITATNRDLAELVREGKFREDLYHRLCVVQIHAPSLREHKEDIEQIANGRWLKEHHRRLEAEQIEVLKTYDYPGNVRELINILDRASVLDESDFSKLLKEHKEMTAGLKPSNEKSEEIPDELEAAVRIHVKRVYEKYDRNLTRTAEALKAARNTVKKYLED